MQRAIEEPIEIMNLNLDLPVPSEIKKFQELSINKELRKQENKEAQKNIALIGYVTDNGGSFDQLEMTNDEINQTVDLN